MIPENGPRTSGPRSSRPSLMRFGNPPLQALASTYHDQQRQIRPKSPDTPNNSTINPA